MKIDWVRLTPSPNHAVNWSGSWQSKQPHSSLSLQTSLPSIICSFTPTAMISTTITSFTLTQSRREPTGQVKPILSLFPLPGPEYVKVAISGQSSPSAGPWQFMACHDVTFVAPSYTSGDDFATKVVGNPWETSDPADVSSWDQHAGPPTFSSHTLTAKRTAASPNC